MEGALGQKIEHWLESFRAAADPGPYAVSYSHYFPPSRSKGMGAQLTYHVIIGAVTHGNECGTLPAVLRLQRELSEGTIELPFAVTLLVGNPEAARRNVRFVEEDLNRVMTFDRPAETLERRRAEEVRLLLDNADFFLDLHQTQTPTQSAFWTLPWEGNLGLWARALGGAEVGLTRSGGATFSPGMCCLDEYVRAQGGVGITLEVGEKGEDDEQAERAYRVMRRTLSCHERLRSGDHLEVLAAEMPTLTWFETKEVVAAESDQHRLRPGISNFTRVRRGQLLSPEGAPEIRATLDGCILFPKYPRPGDPPPPQLFRLAVEVDDPDVAYRGGENPA